MSTQGRPITFYFQTMLGSTGSSLTATSTAAGDYAITNIYNWLETNTWQASSTVAQNITYDAGVGNTKQADYFALVRHNLGTLAPTIALKASSNGAWAGEEVTAFSTVLSADSLYVKEFTDPGPYRYWRFSISTYASTTVPYIGIGVWGQKTNLTGTHTQDGFIQSSFDPHAQTAIANVNITQNGYVAGIHTKYIERHFTLNLMNASTVCYGQVQTWWENHGIKNFIVAWDFTNHSTDVYLMRPDMEYNNPININKYRDITISLKGRKE